MADLSREEEAARKDSCPSCGALLIQDAILCIECGLHLQTGERLTTQVESGNEVAAQVNVHAETLADPYAPPRQAGRTEDTGEFDLDEQGVRDAERVVAGAKTVYIALFFFICLLPIWVPLLGYYAFLLLSWYSLRQRFNELRNPNSFSPHGRLAVEFEDSHFRLAIGVICGFVALALLVVLYVFVG